MDQCTSHVGLAGFNSLERCCILKWADQHLPKIRMSAVTYPQEAEQLEAIVLDEPTYEAWTNKLPPAVPVLLLIAKRICRSQKPQSANVTLMEMTDAAAVLEINIASWFSQIAGPSKQLGKGKRARNLFSTREAQVLDLLRQGASNQQIAEALGITTATVKTYLRRIYERIGASNRAHAVALYKADQG